MNTRKVVLIILLVLIMVTKIVGMSSNEMIVLKEIKNNKKSFLQGNWTSGYWKTCRNMAAESGCVNIPIETISIELQIGRAFAIMAIIIMALSIFNSLIPINFFQGKMYNLIVKISLIVFVGVELFVYNLYINGYILKMKQIIASYNYKYSYGYSWYLNTISSVLFVLTMFLYPLLGNLLTKKK